VKNHESPITKAYLRLFELSQDRSFSNSGHEFVLTWLSAAKMIAGQQVPGLRSVKQLVELPAWKKLLEAGFPEEAYSPYADEQPTWEGQSIGMRIDATTVLGEMLNEVGRHPWSILPTLNDPAVRRSGIGFAVPAELAAVLFDALDAPPGSEVFIPHDSNAQLTLEALSRGLRVCRTKLGPFSESLQPRLTLFVETGFFHHHPSVRNATDLASSSSESKHHYAVVKTPVGRLTKSMEEFFNPGNLNFKRYAQIECDAIYEVLERVSKRAIFLTTQSFLFLNGEEQHVRETLLNWKDDKNVVEAIVELPVGVRGPAAGAMLTVTPSDHNDSVYMASLGSGRRSQLAVDDIISRGRELLLSRGKTEISRYVPRDEIIANDCSFAPARFFARAGDLGLDMVKLGEVCEIVRPPSVSREPTQFPVAELGLSLLTSWQPIDDGIEKTIYLKSPAKDSILVRPGDLVISIKGTVGRVAIVGKAATSRPTVVSQSCVALRLNETGKSGLAPETLLLYLRSPHGQSQLAGLRVGAGVHHISPGTLLSAMSIPLLVESEAPATIHEFKALCNLEAKIVEAQVSMADIVGRRWPTELL